MVRVLNFVEKRNYEKAYNTWKQWGFERINTRSYKENFNLLRDLLEKIKREP